MRLWLCITIDLAGVTRRRLTIELMMIEDAPRAPEESAVKGDHETMLFGQILGIIVEKTA